MLLRAVVPYWGSLAHYAVIPDNHGLYHARLIKYEGPGGITPPQRFIMVRSHQRWISSCEDEPFIHDLGRLIEQRSPEGDATTA